MQKKINPVVQWWVTPKLPAVHLSDNTTFVKKYFFHPIKRRVARIYLKILQSITSLKVIAITGSAGKTTTKEMLASILSEDGSTVYSKANIDPTYNIPSTILRSGFSTKYLILEMGVEYPDEMDFYLWLAKPDIAIITNIFPTHLEFFGDIEGVFKEKSKLALGLSKNSTVILNSGDSKLKELAKTLKTKVIWFKNDANPLVQNGNAASTCAKVLGISEELINNGLEKYQSPPHRLQIIRHKSGAVILDDSYNSNPWAAMSALNYFNKMIKGLPAGGHGKKVAVLGDMLELGKYDETAHRELGFEVAKAGFDTVIGVGKSSKFLLDEVEVNSKSKTLFYSNWTQAVSSVKKLLGKNVYVLIKGSRSIGLDKLVDALS